MATWSDHKDHVRATNPEIAKDIDEVEALSQIVGAMWQGSDLESPRQISIRS